MIYMIYSGYASNRRRVSACITHKVQPMKTRYFVIVIAVILGGIYFANKNKDAQPVRYIQQAVQQKEIIVNPLDEKIKEREKELDAKYAKIKSTEARVDVLKAERERLDTEITGLQKDLALFMIATSSKK